jgi:malate/lactate dehydrogenase
MTHREMTYEERARIPAVVVHYEPEVRNAFAEIVGKQPNIRSRGTFSNAEEYINSLHGNENDQHLIFADADSVLKLKKPLKAIRQSARVVALERSASIYKDNAVAIANNAHALIQSRSVDYVLPVHKETGLGDHDRAVYAEEYEKAFMSLKNEGLLWVPKRIGFVGGGQSTSAIFDQVRGEPWLECAIVHSEHYRNKKDSRVPFIKLFANTTGGRKIQRADDLDALIAAQPDIIWITAGVHRKKFNLPRDVVNAQDLLPGWRKISPALEKIGKVSRESSYKPLVAITTNPVEPYLTLAHRVYGIKKDRLTSLSSDGMRAQDYSWEKLKKLSPILEALQKEDVDVDIWGRHGAGALAVWRRFIQEKGEDTHLHPLMLLESGEQQQIESVTRSAGRHIRDLAEKTRINYKDFPEAAARGLRDIATLQEKPRFSWCIGLPDMTVRDLLVGEDWKEYRDPFLFLPTSLKHNPLSIGLDDANMTFDEMPINMRNYVVAELGKLIREQYHDVYTIAGQEGYKLK